MKQLAPWLGVFLVLYFSFNLWGAVRAERALQHNQKIYQTLKEGCE